MLLISPDLFLPPEVMTLTSAVLGIRGSGKTNSAVVFTEELLDANQQVIIIDPLDVWFGLKSSADGLEPGYAVVILGGIHGDLPLGAGDGAVLADFLVENCAPAILSLRHLRKSEQKRFVADFAEQLYQKKGESGRNTPLLVVIDEASSFVPQKVEGDSARMVGAIEDLVRRGRASGIGVMLIDQRAASVNKDVLTQLELLIAHRHTSPQDRAALKLWVQAHDTGDQEKKFMDSLASLPRGEAWFWSPGFLDIFQRVQVRHRRTFDSSATPELGKVPPTPTHQAQIDLEALREKLGATLEEAKSNDPKELKRQLNELYAELKARPIEIERVEVSVLRPEEIERLENVGHSVIAVSKDLHQIGADILAAVRLAAVRTAQPAGETAREEQEQQRMRAMSNRALDAMKAAPDDKPENKPVTQRVVTQKVVAQKAAAPSARPAISLRAGERKMMEVLARTHPFKLTRKQLATLAGLSIKGGTFGTYYSTLRKNGLIEEEGKETHLTQRGFDWLGHDVPREPMSEDEVLQQWLNVLRLGERSMLRYLVGKEGHYVARGDLAKHCDLTLSGGTFGTYLSTLRRNGLIEERGNDVRAGGVFYIVKQIKERLDG